MDKQRSLLPSFGKCDSLGKYFNGYNKRLPEPGESWGACLIRNHYKGLNLATKTYQQTYYVMGQERFISTEKFYQDNCCDHLIMYRANYPFTYGDFNGGWIYTHFFCRRKPENVTAPNVESLRLAHIGNLGRVDDGIRSAAYWDMRPKFEGEFSMLNFLYELKDFRDIAKILCSNGRNNPIELLRRRFVDFDARYLDTSRVNTPRVKAPVKQLPDMGNAVHSATGDLATARLLESFVIRPLVNDVISIFKQLHQMVDEAEATFAANGVGTKRYWTQELNSTANFGTDIQSGTTVIRPGSKLSGRYTASTSMSYKYTPRDRFNKTLAYWGLTPTAEAAWNAIPFSFLVDYFFSVGRSLKRMRTDPNVTAYTLSNYVESVLTSYQGGKLIASHPTYTDGHMGFVLDDKYYPVIKYDEPKLVDGYVCSFYTRMLAQPYYGPALPRFKRPTSDQFINMAALARCLLQTSPH